MPMPCCSARTGQTARQTEGTQGVAHPVRALVIGPLPLPYGYSNHAFPAPSWQHSCMHIAVRAGFLSVTGMAFYLAHALLSNPLACFSFWLLGLVLGSLSRWFGALSEASQKLATGARSAEVSQPVQLQCRDFSTSQTPVFSPCNEAIAALQVTCQRSRLLQLWS